MTMWDNDKDVNGDNLEEDHEYRCVENTTDEEDKAENTAKVEELSCPEVNFEVFHDDYDCSAGNGFPSLCLTGPLIVDTTDKENNAEVEEPSCSEVSSASDGFPGHCRTGPKIVDTDAEEDNLDSDFDNTEVNGLSGKDEESQDLMSAGADPNMKPNLRMKKNKESNLKMKKKMPFKIFITWFLLLPYLLVLS